MNIYLVLSISLGLIASIYAEDLRLVDLPPEEAQQHIESKDQTLKYAPKIESNVPAVRVLGDTPTNVLEDVYLANQYHGQDGLGGYLYGYSVPDIAKTEKKKAGGDLKGAYQYINGGGQEIKVQYWDDGTGFHQVDNLPEVLPKQVEDAPDVQAAKEEFFRRWHEEAERNSKPISPNTAGEVSQSSQQQYQPGYQSVQSQFTSGQSTLSGSGGSAHSNSYQQASQNVPSYTQSGQNQYQVGLTQPGVYSTGQGEYQSGPGKGQVQSDQNQAVHGQYLPNQSQYQLSKNQPNQGQYQSSQSDVSHVQYQPEQNQGSQSHYQSSQGQLSQGPYKPGIYQESQSHYQPNQRPTSQGQYQPDKAQESQSQYQSSQGQSNQGQYLPGQILRAQSNYQLTPSQSSQGHYQERDNQPGQFGQSSCDQCNEQQTQGQNEGSHLNPNEQYQSGQTQTGQLGQTYPSQNQAGQARYQLGHGQDANFGGDYSGQSTNQKTYTQNQPNIEWEYKESNEEKGPPRGFFYNFDYPVGIIVQKQGAGGGVHKRESLGYLFAQNKAHFDHQLKNGVSGDGSSQSSYQVHL